MGTVPARGYEHQLRVGDMNSAHAYAKFGLSAAVSRLAGRRVLNCLWELTYRCNARCQICAYWRHPSDIKDELTCEVRSHEEDPDDP